MNALRSFNALLLEQVSQRTALNRELAMESRIDSCPSVIQILEGKSGLICTNVPDSNHATAFQKTLKEQATAYDQFPSKPCLTRRLEDSSVNRNYGFDSEEAIMFLMPFTVTK